MGITFEYFSSVFGSHHSLTRVGFEEIARICSDEKICQRIDEYRKTGNQALKKNLPCICPMGNCNAKRERKASEMTPNNLGMIDLDKLPSDYQQLKEFMGKYQTSDYLRADLVMAYITVSGRGLRLIFPLFDNLSLHESAILILMRLCLPIAYLDLVTTDISRLSILTKREDILFTNNISMEKDNTVQKIKMTDGEEEFVNQMREKHGKQWVEYIVKESAKGTDEKNKSQSVPGIKEADVAKPLADASDEDAAASEAAENAKDNQDVPYKKYTEAQIQENDLTYGSFRFKGRFVKDLALMYVKSRYGGEGPEHGERHALYNQMCKNFRNMVDNDPVILHAVLPTFNHAVSETWAQCVYYTATNKSAGVYPKDFWWWCEKNHFFEKEEENEELPEISQEYTRLVSSVPNLPPIIKEYFSIAPHWFKIPTLVSLESILSLFATNYRAKYIDGLPLSLSFYDIIYAPQSSGKSFLRRLDHLLDKTRLRDNLSMMKQVWYNQLALRRSHNQELPEEPKVKQRLFAARASVGQMCISQKNIGEHHFLQIISEFDIWADAVTARNCDLSAFYRTSWDNEYFSQQYQSPNSFRGSVKIFPIILATCTEGQINRFFKNVEDGLVTRFDFIPLLEQDFADIQPWGVMTDIDNNEIERTMERLEKETYATPLAENAEELSVRDMGKQSNWDYELLPPREYNVSYLYEPLHKWLLEKLDESVKEANPVSAMLRKRSARKGFMFGLLALALFGNDSTQERKQNIIDLMLWRAELSFKMMRYKWEDVMLEKTEHEKRKSKGLRDALFDSLPNSFTATDVEAALVGDGRKTPARIVIYQWKKHGLIIRSQKNVYTKQLKTQGK